MIHYNDVRKYLGYRPEWAGDCIPLCGCDGDAADDRYTFESEAVTCQACLDELAYSILLEMAATTARRAA